MNKKIIKRRYQKERIFSTISLGVIILSITLLLILLTSIIAKSYQTLMKPEIKLYLGTKTLTSKSNINKIIHQAIARRFYNERHVSHRKLYKLINLDSINLIKNKIKQGRNIRGNIWLPASGIVGVYLKDRNLIKDLEFIYILDKLKSDELLRLKFSTTFFTNTDSRESVSAGIKGGVIGSLMTISICLLCALPIGVFSAIYLEEFARCNIFTKIIEINISNLATVPSIVYGLIGLAIFINELHMPRSSALVGGLTLSFLTLPTIILATRQSLQSVPSNIKEGALALGASKIQAVTHHILPAAIPGIVTGCILSTARALGETAPLVMLGMVAFIADIPSNIFEPTTTMPVLIYTWSESPESSFVEKTSAAILCLTVFIMIINYLAIYLRNKYEQRW